MKICITNPADEPVEFREGQVLEELLANIPPNHGWFLVQEAAMNEVGDPVPPLEMPRTKIAIFNANNLPINVIEGTVEHCATVISKLPPTQKALTLKGTQWENVEMAGDLLDYDTMVASINQVEEG